MELKPSEILQIDATVATGVLILLTISAEQQHNPVWQLGKGFAFLSWILIIPFCVSAFYALRSLSPKYENDINTQKKKLHSSRQFMGLGFLVLIGYIGVYAVTLAFFSP